MKRFVLVLLCLLAPVSLFAQSTTLSGTITDLAGQSWIQGTYALSFKVSPSNPTAQYFWNGSPFSSTTNIQGRLDSSGHFSVSVPSNTSITPAGSTWVLEFCSIARGNSPCYSTQGITITGATQSVSSIHPPAISIDLTHIGYPFVTAYSSSEITTATFAGLFWNYTLSHYFICEAISPSGNDQTYGACTNWVEICQFGDTTCGGAGSSLTIEHNGTVVGTQPILNLIDGTNVTLTVVNNSGATRIDTTVAATGGGTGCTLPGINTAVLSEHPASTCYDSLHWTWDDGTTKQNMQAGLTNILTNDVLSFAFGRKHNLTNISGGNAGGAFVAGGSTSVSADGTSFIGDVFVLGDNNNLGSPLTISSTGGSNVVDIMCLLWACENAGGGGVSASGASGVNMVFEAGRDVNVTSTGGNTSSIFVLGESSTFSSAAGCNNSDNFMLGEVNTVGCSTVATSDIDDVVTLGQNHSVTSTTHNLSFAYLMGHNDTLVQSSGANIADMMVLGKNLTLTNCSDCYLFGEGMSGTTNNTLSIGMTSTPAIVVTPSDVTVKGTLKSPTITTIGGNISLSANTLTTVTTRAVTMPSTGCPCRAFVSYSVYLTGSSSQIVMADVSDGTNRFAAGGLLITGSHSFAACTESPPLFSSASKVKVIEALFA